MLKECIAAESGEPFGKGFRSLRVANSHYLVYDVLEGRGVALVFDQIRLVIVNLWTVVFVGSVDTEWP